MYWRNVQGFRVKALVVCCSLLRFRARARERQLKQKFGACFFVGLFVCTGIIFQQHLGDITGDMGKSS